MIMAIISKSGRAGIPVLGLSLQIGSCRAGATLMYLAGIDACDIIKITGHGNIDILKTPLDIPDFILLAFGR